MVYEENMVKSKINLVHLAKQAMIARGLQPEFSSDALHQLEKVHAPASCSGTCEDLRSLLWCSIDNDTSRDLDQLTFAQKEADGTWTLWIAVADVDVLVRQNSPLDHHAEINTTSVYTPAIVFPMFPEKLSTNLTSLNEGEDRPAMVVKLALTADGEMGASSIFRATVRNHAKLAYNSVGAWLEGDSGVPDNIKRVPGLEEALLCQWEATKKLKMKRQALGALTLQPIGIVATLLEGEEVKLEAANYTSARQLIEHFMIAANHAMAIRLKEARVPSLRRVVREPKRWHRIQDIASRFGCSLPDHPQTKALEDFLLDQKQLHPETFPDLSLTIIKLLGRGEYVVELAGDTPVGHFGLALTDYTHSTAPNRRFPDLITQRQYKAILKGELSPYTIDDLERLAIHCTKQEDAASKIERQMTKSAAALLLSAHIGKQFKAIVTGSSPKGVWVRIQNPPIEGKVLHGGESLDVGDHAQVRLVSVDIPKGHINFRACSDKA